MSRQGESQTISSVDTADLGMDSRLRTRTSEGQDATMSSLVTLQSLLVDAQTKLDSLVTAAKEEETVRPAESPTAYKEVVAPSPQRVEEAEDIILDDAVATAQLILAHDEVARKQRERELVAVGAAGAAVGVVLSLLLRIAAGS